MPAKTLVVTRSEGVIHRLQAASDFAVDEQGNLWIEGRGGKPFRVYSAGSWDTIDVEETADVVRGPWTPAVVS